MKKIFLDEYTKEAATDFANNEARMRGFEIGSPQWKTCFKKYLGFAVGTMTVGRNPIRRNPRDVGTWPDIFSATGFAGQVAKNYKGKEGEKVTLDEIQERIRSSVSALAYMYLNGIYGIKTTTQTSKSGKIPTSQMSDLQLHGAGEAASEDEKVTSQEENVSIAKNQLALTIVESAIYEFLLPFFTMGPDQVKKIVDGVKIEGKVTAPGMADARTQTEKRIRKEIGDKLKNLRFDKLVIGE